MDNLKMKHEPDEMIRKGNALSGLYEPLQSEVKKLCAHRYGKYGKSKLMREVSLLSVKCDGCF